MESFNSVIRFLQDGGIFMYPLLLILALGLAIALERYFFLASTERDSKKIWDALIPHINKGNYPQAMAITSKSKAAIGTVFNYGLSRIRTSQRRDDIETAMEEGMMEVLPHLEKRTHYLATFANIATLLGLLGTIIGLIQAFTAVSNADPAEKADLLSSSISVAMNTTAFGLIVAIPLLLIHTVLQTKTTGIVDNLEMSAVKFLNLISSPKSSPKE
ncbi:MAG: MotA/TolQ/ExbB proton channel family protein [Gammaproteobacteria bacterium]